MEKKKIAFVVQRYGKEITGGSESHCRSVVERLADLFEIRVLTTCAKDYWTWCNAYPAGEDRVNGIPVLRFPNRKTRDIASFNDFSTYIFHHTHTREEELHWLEEQGPYCPDMIDFIEKEKNAFDLFFFFTYLYYPAYHGIKIVGERSLIQPTAHDEPAILLQIYREMFRAVRGIAFNTPTEETFLRGLFPLDDKHTDCIGAGVDLPAIQEKERPDTGPYILYGGRIAAGKGCAELIDFFLRFREEEGNGPVELVLIGNREMELPDHPALKCLGFVSEAEKKQLLLSSLFVVIPSPHESLSLLLLEAFSCRKSVLVNGRCQVLKDHCLQSNGGLFYENYEEFKECLRFLVNEKARREAMGDKGYHYAAAHYSWEKVKGKYRHLIRKMMAG